jgi:iron complex outermembrane recepter protein
MKKKLTFLNVLALILLIGNVAIAQKTVSGTVFGTNKETLIGASILVQGTTKGTVTDIDGKYSIEVPVEGKTLIFSYTGYQTQNVVVGTSTTVDVDLREGVELNNIVVIGSRNATRTKLSTPVPVDVIPVQSIINEVGQVDLNQLLTYVAPSFQSARQTVADGTDHVDPASLRGMGTDQVLVLVNGKRRHQSSLVNVNGTVNRGQVGTDLGAISASSVERIEILRDGAAAQYGSDAIAGVINIVLKKQTGLSGSVSYGMNVTEYAKNRALVYGTNNDPYVKVQDGENLQVGLSYGLKIGKGHLNFGVEYLDRGATNRGGTFTGALYPNVAGKNRDDSIMTAKGYTRDRFDMAIGNSAIKGIGGMVNFSLPINDNMEIYAFGGYNTKSGKAAGFYRYAAGIPAKSNALEIYPDGFLPFIESKVNDLSAAVGLRGKLGTWNYDVSNTFGQNTFDFDVTNSINYTQSGKTGSATAKRDFKAGGTKLFQNTTNLDLSRKYNVLSGLNFAAGAEFRLEGYGITAGEEASYKNYDTGLGVASGSQVFAGFFPQNAGDHSRNALGAYVDVEQDLSENLMFGGAIRFENYSDFGSTINYKLTSRWKVDEKTTVRGSLSTGFRAPSMQQKYYAKTNTLFVTVGGVLTAQETGTFTNDSKVAAALGIPTLKQETSQSYSLGFTRRLMDDFDLTVDGYRIDIKDRIVLTNNFSAGSDADLKAKFAEAGASTVNVFTNAVDTRALGLESVLSWHHRFGAHDWRVTGAYTYIRNKVLTESDKGISNLEIPAVKATDVLIRTGQIGAYFNREDQSRLEVASPLSKAAITLNYKNNGFGVMVRAAYFGKVIYRDPTINPLDTVASYQPNKFDGGTKRSLDQTFSPKWVTDLTLSYTIMKKYTISVGANNLFDVYQDEHTHWNNMSNGRFIYSRRVQQMGFNGRYVFAKVNVNLTK